MGRFWAENAGSSCFFATDFSARHRDHDPQTGYPSCLFSLLFLTFCSALPQTSPDAAKSKNNNDVFFFLFRISVLYISITGNMYNPSGPEHIQKSLPRYVLHVAVCVLFVRNLCGFGMEGGREGGKEEGLCGGPCPASVASPDAPNPKTCVFVGGIALHTTQNLHMMCCSPSHQAPCPTLCRPRPKLSLNNVLTLCGTLCLGQIRTPGHFEKLGCRSLAISASFCLCLSLAVSGCVSLCVSVSVSVSLCLSGATKQHNTRELLLTQSSGQWNASGKNCLVDGPLSVTKHSKTQSIPLKLNNKSMPPTTTQRDPLASRTCVKHTGF